jgi:hypothetical protein
MMERRSSRTGRISARGVGALAAGGLVSGAIAFVAVIHPFGIDLSKVMERPEIVLGFIVVAAGLGWWAGRIAASRGWLRSIGVGAVVGASIWPAFVVLAILVSTIDAVLRGTAGPLDGLGVAIAWGLYGTIVLCVISVVAVPIGIVWGMITMVLARRTSSGPGSRHPGRVLLGALAAVALVGGASQAIAAQPAAAMCRAMASGAVTDAAFSPAGDLLAIATQTDPNEPGTIVLMRWPSGEEIARWHAWIDQELAVSPTGEVYWSAWVLGFVTMDERTVSAGIYVGRPGAEPEWFATGEESPLNDLTWTTHGLRGTTPNSHRVSAIHAGSAGPRSTGREVGAFWSSADASWTATGPAWEGTSVLIAGPGSSVAVNVHEDQRSIALTADRSTLVAASWFDGTRTFDVATGASRLIIRGSQRFIALSSRGDLAWANEEMVGKSRLCTAALADL